MKSKIEKVASRNGMNRTAKKLVIAKATLLSGLDRNRENNARKVEVSTVTEVFDGTERELRIEFGAEKNGRKRVKVSIAIGDGGTVLIHVDGQQLEARTQTRDAFSAFIVSQ